MTPAHVTHGLDGVDAAPSVVTIGFFDGVHRGHQAIIGRAVREARDRGLRSVVVTFDRHPMEVVRPGSQPRYLQTLDRRARCLAEQDVDLVVVLPFTEEFSQLPPDDFVETVLAGSLRARRVVVGANFRFGHRAAGDVTTLTDRGAVHGFEAEAVALVDLEEAPISSTRIREHLELGDVTSAARALGRPFVVEGPVVHGEGRGGSIGIPTANVEVDDRMQVPAAGVYAGHAGLVGHDERWSCVVNIGTRPTFSGTTTSIEAHLLDAEVDLYGEHLAIAFRTRLRDERRFDGPDELVAQIHRDIEAARAEL